MPPRFPRRPVLAIATALAVFSVAACGVPGAAGQTSVTSTSASPPPSPLPSLATPGPSISPQFLAFVDSDAFYVQPAPADAQPTVSKADAEALARSFPATHGVVNGSMLGQCVVQGKDTTPTKSYLCWVIDGTSHQPDPLAGGPRPSSGQTPGPDATTFSEYYVIVDAQRGSATSGTIVMSAG